jgi:hypothetical protein
MKAQAGSAKLIVWRNETQYRGGSWLWRKLKRKRQPLAAESLKCLAVASAA